MNNFQNHIIQTVNEFNQIHQTHKKLIDYYKYLDEPINQPLMQFEKASYNQNYPETIKRIKEIREQNYNIQKKYMK